MVAVHRCVTPLIQGAIEGGVRVTCAMNHTMAVCCRILTCLHRHSRQRCIRHPTTRSPHRLVDIHHIGGESSYECELLSPK